MSKFGYYPVSKILKNSNSVKELKAEIKPSSKWYSWGYSCDRCKSLLKSYVMQYEQFYKEPNDLILKWNNCHLDCEIIINRVAYNYDNAWIRKEYEILKQLNEFTVKGDISVVSSLFKRKAYIEYSNLEGFTKRFYLKSNPKKIVKTKTWNKSKERAYFKFRKLLKNKTRNDFERQNLWGLCLDNILASSLLNRPFKNKDRGFVGINKIHLEKGYKKVRNCFR